MNKKWINPSEKLRDGDFRGKYIMYFGDSHIWMAVSRDLINWEYIKEPVLSPRGGHFDNVFSRTRSSFVRD